METVVDGLSYVNGELRGQVDGLRMELLRLRRRSGLLQVCSEKELWVVRC